MNRPLLWMCLAWVTTSLAQGGAPHGPVISQTQAFLVGGRDHESVAQSALSFPVLELAPFTVVYRFQETTPFLTERAQAQLLYTRHDGEVGWQFHDHLRLLAVAGWHRVAFEDRPGSFRAVAVGAGLGSGRSDRWEWRALAGAYVGREDFDAQWWTEASAHWRMLELPVSSEFRTTLGLALDIAVAGDGANARGHYELGPALEMTTAHGNRARLTTGWYFDDGHPSYGGRDSALWLGFRVEGAMDRQTLLQVRDQRPTGWLPLVWGQYDLGYGNARSVQRFELDAEIHDLDVLGHRITGRLWFESRTEYRAGDFDNIAYSVSIGPQTVIGGESFLSQGQPLVLGCDFLHRSAHALDPSADRVRGTDFLERNSINLAPRLRLQTLGWDWIYREPAMYDRATRWLHFVDWRVTVGYDFQSSRDRPNPAAQLGLNWDVVSLRGYVFYARAVGSVGNETPDWLAEVGVRRPVGRVFFCAEKYGLESQLARGEAFVAGVGLHL